jgi:hypothetical protein
MYNVCISYQNKNIQAVIIHNTDWKRVNSLFAPVPLSFKYQLTSIKYFINQHLENKSNIKCAALKHILLHRIAQLKRLVNLSRYIKCADVKAFIAAVNWYLKIEEKLLLLLGKVPMHDKIAKSEFLQQCILFERKSIVTMQVSKATICVQVKKSIDNRRTYLNIPQRAIATLEDYSTRVINKKSPYLLVGLMS